MNNIFFRIWVTIALFLSFVTNHCIPTNNKDLMITKIKEFEIPLTEDLMGEHGILSRILLIYEKIIKNIDTHTKFSISDLNDAAHIIKSFIEDYHEKLEENYVFPIFENHGKETELTKTLRDQHKKGRTITIQVQKILQAKRNPTKRQNKILKELLQKFITMYRPHKSREDTILFPQIRGLISEHEFHELSEKFEDLENELFGKNCFENIIKKIESIESNLGIYQLNQFTPKGTILFPC